MSIYVNQLVLILMWHMEMISSKQTENTFLNRKIMLSHKYQLQSIFPPWFWEIKKLPKW